MTCYRKRRIELNVGIQNAMRHAVMVSIDGNSRKLTNDCYIHNRLLFALFPGSRCARMLFGKLLGKQFYPAIDEPHRGEVHGERQLYR